MSRGGSTANNTNNNTGGGLFGQKPATRGSSLFGGNNTNTGATSGGLFSSLSNNNQQNTESSSLFGGGQNNNQQKPSGLFGGSTNNSTRGGLFGGGLGQSNNGLRQFKDFPKPCILFEDILPIFADPQLHEGLLRGLELSIEQQFGASGAKPDVVVGLDARGFLFGPSLALRLGASFVPVRKRGKLPGPCETAEYKKEYGSDFFQMQADAIKSGQKVLIVDDIIATGGSAAAAGSLVKKLGGTIMGYLFILELDFLKGRDQLDAPVHTLLSGQEEKMVQ